MTKLIKHSAAIQLSGSLTLAQRQTYNALLKNAYPWMERGEDHWIQVKDLERLLQKQQSRNRAWLIETAESLRDVSVRYNILGKDRQNSEVWQMHSGLLAEVGTKSNRSLIKYSFPNTLVDLLRSPSMYAKINLDFQSRFRGHYGLPLYEFYLDILGGKRRSTEYTLWIEDLRRLLCLEGKHVQYKHLASKVIKPAHREICEHTDIHVSITEQIREDRNVVALKIHIERTGLGVAAPEFNDSSAFDGPVHQALSTHYSPDTVAMILNRYSTPYIQAQLAYLDQERKRISIKNPAGWLRKAIQADYAGFRERPTTKDKNSTGTPAEPYPVEQLTPDAALHEFEQFPADCQERLWETFTQSNDPLIEHMLKNYDRDSVAIRNLLADWLIRTRAIRPKSNAADSA